MLWKPLVRHSYDACTALHGSIWPPHSLLALLALGLGVASEEGARFCLLLEDLDASLDDLIRGEGEGEVGRDAPDAGPDAREEGPEALLGSHPRDAVPHPLVRDGAGLGALEARLDDVTGGGGAGSDDAGEEASSHGAKEGVVALLLEVLLGQRIRGEVDGGEGDVPGPASTHALVKARQADVLDRGHDPPPGLAQHLPPDLEHLHRVRHEAVRKPREAAGGELDVERELVLAELLREHVARRLVGSNLDGHLGSAADDDGQKPPVEGEEPLLARDLADGLDGVAVGALGRGNGHLSLGAALHADLGRVHGEHARAGEAARHGGHPEVLGRGGGAADQVAGELEGVLGLGSGLRLGNQGEERVCAAGIEGEGTALGKLESHSRGRHGEACRCEGEGACREACYERRRGPHFL
mmetsp:Transcript_10500/g.25964  ORF Transcript_10500/g.25964 Transcript_10500/m.25964 type:complete len:412 (+) Transcript_10500:354-1589(+)